MNSQTKIPKIHLPLIEELFDQMTGCTVYTVIDLAQGYHQMLVIEPSRQYTAFLDSQGDIPMVCCTYGLGRNARRLVSTYAGPLR